MPVPSVAATNTPIHPISLRLLVALTLLGAFGCTTDSATDDQDQRPPNVVLFLADDQGWGDLSINGNANIETLHIDGLAHRGARFSHFFVSPVCSPTRAELLTGRYHPRGGVYSTSAGGERLDLDETTIAEIFNEAGYATGAFGKWHNGTQAPYHPNSRGFDEYYGFASGHWGHYFSPMLEHNGRIVQGNGYVVDDFTDRAISFIEQHRNQPFFVYLPYNTPHSPMQVPDRWWAPFEQAELAMRHKEPDREDVEHTKAALAMVENIDWNVGRVLDTLDELALTGNTIVLYLTDNGPNGWRWNGGMRGRKGSTDEGGVRSPLHIQWPGVIPEGLVVDRIAASIDLLPTLADLAGIDFEAPRGIDGISLKPLLTESPASWPDRILFSHWGGRVSARTQQYRLDHENRLYHMIDDPEQEYDLSEEEPGRRNELVEAKSEWEQTVLAELTREQRPFTVGYPDQIYTHLPARDAVATGSIERSNRYPNDSFFRNWTRTDEEIYWDVDVIEAGSFDVTIYYTLAEEHAGTKLALTLGSDTLRAVIEEAHDPPLVGAGHDRVERQESYVKDFRPLNMGTMNLAEGRGRLTLRATEIPGHSSIDFRLLLLKRI